LCCGKQPRKVVDLLEGDLKRLDGSDCALADLYVKSFVAI